MTEVINFGLFPSYALNYNTLCFEGRFVFPSSGMLLPKQMATVTRISVMPCMPKKRGGGNETRPKNPEV
jgi:hypothetical protein